VDGPSGVSELTNFQCVRAVIPEFDISQGGDPVPSGQ
jgi:hypothetical protein